MSLTKLASVVAVLAFASVAAASDAYAHASVLDLTADDFESTVEDGKVYFIKFYAPWCGHCKTLAPTWGELADALSANDSIKVAHVDCTKHRSVCTEAQVKGFPTLKVFYKGEELKTYGGPRQLTPLRDFIEEAAKEVLTEV